MKYFLLLIFTCFAANVNAQVHKCYTDKAKERYHIQDASLRLQYENQEAIVRQWIADNKHTLKKSNSGVIVQIPVVMHVVYKNATQNIADSNLTRQIAVLNESFRMQDPNFSQTRPIFDTIAADVEVEFCLATVDPAGNPTDGITRTQAPAGTFFDPLIGFDNVKSAATGGIDPWPSSQYLNIWICDMSFLGIPLVLGYATFPGGPVAKDGVVIQYNFIGNMANNTTSDKGKTAVHEVGHWMGLRHIWGDGQLSSTLCDSTDYVDDTPNADTASQQTCLIKNSCTNESQYWTLAGIDPPDMIENYMDYSYDDCMTMFTQGQKTRMLGFLNTTRASLLTSPGCTPTGLNEDAEISVSIYPNPVSDRFTIRTHGINNGEMQLFDVTGRLLKVLTLGETTQVSIADLAPGMIFYTITKDNKSFNGKLLKTKN